MKAKKVKKKLIMKAVVKKDHPSFKYRNRPLKAGTEIEVEPLEKYTSMGIDVDKPCVYSKKYRVLGYSFWLPLEDLEL